MASSDSPDGCGVVIAVCIVSFLSFVCGSFVGFNNGVESMEKKCIAAGVAEYRLKDGTRESEFFFKGKQ